MVIWFHYGGGTAQGLLRSIVPEPDRMDVAPNGLMSYGPLPDPELEAQGIEPPPGQVWGLPGLPDIDELGLGGYIIANFVPENMHPSFKGGPRVSKWHDLQLVCLLIQDLRRRFPDLRRIWLAGFSKGCSMVSASYAFNNMGHRPGMEWAWPLSLVRGYYLGDFGVTMFGTIPNKNGYGWNIVDGIDWGWVLTNSTPTRRADEPGQPSGVVRPMDPIVRPVLLRHGSETYDALPHEQGFVKTW